MNKISSPPVTSYEPWPGRSGTNYVMRRRQNLASPPESASCGNCTNSSVKCRVVFVVIASVIIVAVATAVSLVIILGSKTGNRQISHQISKTLKKITENSWLSTIYILQGPIIPHKFI